MNKREFLSAAAGVAVLPASSFAANSPAAARGPALLTVTGAVNHGNRGPFDPAFDQMMKKQGVHFEHAYAFDFAALAALPAVSIRPTLEYDGKRHTLAGPLVTEVLRAAGAAPRDEARLVLRAVDGYAVVVPVPDIRKYRFIVATHLDSNPLPLGGLGPLWAVYEADRFADMAARPVSDRFALCPWGLYNIEVQQLGMVKRMPAGRIPR